MFSTTQCVFSPDERLIVTGTSADRKGQGGALVFVDRQSLEVVRRVSMPASVVALHWHERLNQIFVGTGASAWTMMRCRPHVLQCLEKHVLPCKAMADFVIFSKYRSVTRHCVVSQGSMLIRDLASQLAG